MKRIILTAKEFCLKIEKKHIMPAVIAGITFFFSPVPECNAADSILFQESATEIQVNGAVSGNYEKYDNVLQEIAALEEGWDYEDAPVIAPAAIDHCRQLLTMLPQAVINSDIRIYPVETGAIGVKLQTDSGMLRLEIGSELMSYFLRRNGEDTVYHSFEMCTEENYSNLISSFSQIV